MEPINIKEKHTLFSKQWHPHRIATVDNMQVLLAKLKGEFVWHSHENEDELFQVIKGTLHMQFRDRTQIVNEGEIIVVPKGVEHNPRTENAQIILDEMEVGVAAENYKKTLSILDRKQAIKTACKFSENGDIILIAGKGHENYQEINGERFYFDDLEEVKKCFNQLKKN